MLTPLKTPIDTFFFDCDSTLSLIEGIDILAKMNGVYDQVQAITERCMSTTGLTIDAYKERLDMVKPTAMQIKELSHIYKEHTAPGARETIQALLSLNKNLYILSGGIKSAVAKFGEFLGIALDHSLAVDVFFDTDGNYKGFDKNSFLVQPFGKPQQIKSIIKENQRSLLIGDGMSDWEAHDTVSLFVGYAGLKAKEQIKQHSDIFINTTSFYSLLPLSLTAEEFKMLEPKYKKLYQIGVEEINQGLVIIKDHNHDQRSSTR